MTELLPLPKINTKNDELVDNFPSNPVELSEDQLSNILTNVVRQKYFNFLEKLLADNYENSLCPGDNLSITDIKKCAEYLEFKAIRSCMIVNLYQNSILSIFAEIRNDTAQKKLNINLSTERICQRKTRRNVQIQTDLRPPATIELNNPPKPTKRKHLRNVRSQTDFVDSAASSTSNEYNISLDERIRIFEKKFREEDQQFMHNFSNSFPTKKINLQDRFKENRKRRHSSISLESPHSSVDSSIHRSVERTDSRVDSCTDNEIMQLTNSGNNASLALLATPTDSVGIKADDNVAEELMALFGDEEETDIFGEAINTVERSHHVEHSEKINDEDCTAKNILDISTPTNLKKQSIKVHDYTLELKNSIWPCELHMQRMKLHEALMKNADRGFRYSEHLKGKFEELFGPEDDDDDNTFAPYSPTIELDEILMASCKKRIAPWIVKHLKPIGDGLIENRFLFKKVAKHIAEKVILRDQYPDEQQIKRAITDFFKTHAYIGSVDDIA